MRTDATGLPSAGLVQSIIKPGRGRAQPPGCPPPGGGGGALRPLRPRSAHGQGPPSQPRSFLGPWLHQGGGRTAHGQDPDSTRALAPPGEEESEKRRRRGEKEQEREQDEQEAGRPEVSPLARARPVIQQEQPSQAGAPVAENQRTPPHAPSRGA